MDDDNDDDDASVVPGMVVKQEVFVEAFMHMTKETTSVVPSFTVHDAVCVAVAFDSALIRNKMVDVQAFNDVVVGEHTSRCVPLHQQDQQQQCSATQEQQHETPRTRAASLENVMFAIA
jgi:hypothetical protein